MKRNCSLASRVFLIIVVISMAWGAANMAADTGARLLAKLPTQFHYRGGTNISGVWLANYDPTSNTCVTGWFKTVVLNNRKLSIMSFFSPDEQALLSTQELVNFRVVPEEEDNVTLVISVWVSTGTVAYSYETSWENSAFMKNYPGGIEKFLDDTKPWREQLLILAKKLPQYYNSIKNLDCPGRPQVPDGSTI